MMDRTAKLMVYRPSVRTKGGEYAALATLPIGERSHVEPIFVIAPPGERDPRSGKLFTANTLPVSISGAIARLWGQARCFASCEALNDQVMGISPDVWLADTYSRMRQGAHTIIPALPMALFTTYAARVASRAELSATGVMVVIQVQDLARGDVRSKIIRTAEAAAVAPSQIHIMLKLEGLDLGFVAKNSSAILGIAEDLISFPDWASLTVQVSSELKKLPKARGGISRTFRADREAFVAIQAALGLRVDYSDFPGNHSDILKMQSKGGGTRPIEHLRYLTANEHLISGGHGQIKTSPTESIREVAKRLVDLPEYKGPSFSDGDRYLDDLAKGARTGRPTDWKEASVNHHVVMIINEFDLAPPSISKVTTEEQTELFPA
jgi:Beta protein